MAQNTNFPQRPKRGGDWWTVWYNLQWLANSVVDVFANKFQQGSASIAVGGTTVTVTGLSVGASYSVSLTPTVDPAARYWVSGKSGTQFTINLSAAAPLGGVSFDWTVKAT